MSRLSVDREIRTGRLRKQQRAVEVVLISL